MVANLTIMSYISLIEVHILYFTFIKLICKCVYQDQTFSEGSKTFYHIIIELNFINVHAISHTWK